MTEDSQYFSKEEKYNTRPTHSSLFVFFSIFFFQFCTYQSSNFILGLALIFQKCSRELFVRFLLFPSYDTRRIASAYCATLS